MAELYSVNLYLNKAVKKCLKGITPSFRKHLNKLLKISLSVSTAIILPDASNACDYKN